MGQLAAAPADINVEEVERHLNLSKVCHLQYQAEQRKRDANYRLCEQYVAEALEHRQLAHDLDPQHRAHIWVTDEPRWSHKALMKFYREYPTRP